MNYYKKKKQGREWGGGGAFQGDGSLSLQVGESQVTPPRPQGGVKREVAASSCAHSTGSLRGPAPGASEGSPAGQSRFADRLPILTPQLQPNLLCLSVLPCQVEVFIVAPPAQLQRRLWEGYTLSTGNSPAFQRASPHRLPQSLPALPTYRAPQGGDVK